MKWISGCLLVLVLASCSYSTPMQVLPPPRGKGVLSGNVTYRERSALPPNAEVTVRLWDALAPPATAKVGETKFIASGQVPLPFQLFFDPELIQASHIYGVRATISVEGTVWFETVTPVPVLTQGAKTVDVEVVVQRAAAPPS